MMKSKVALLVPGAIVAPFLVLSVYLYFSRWPTGWFTATSDFVGLGLSIAAGTVFLLHLPISGWLRVLITVLYLPMIGAALFFYCFMFVGVVFNTGCSSIRLAQSGPTGAWSGQLTPFAATHAQVVRQRRRLRATAGCPLRGLLQEAKSSLIGQPRSCSTMPPSTMIAIDPATPTRRSLPWWISPKSGRKSHFWKSAAVRAKPPCPWRQGALR